MDKYDSIIKGLQNELISGRKNFFERQEINNKIQKIILSDLPVKGRDIYDYMLENFTDPKIFDATFDLIQITDKIK